MAIRASAQIDLIDLTDGFTVVLTNENHTFLGTTSAVDGTQTATCQVQVLQGENVVNCEVGDVTLTKSGSVIIPVKIGEITINKTFSWSIAFRGSNGTSVTIKSTEVTYQVGASGTTAPTSAWSSTVPTVGQGAYLWTKTVVTYSDGKSTTSYSVSRQGVNGSNGKDALVTVISSLNGTIFKNTDIATTLIARVYQGGAEVTGSALTALGTIKWYKDGETTSIASGQTFTVSAGDVTNKATYTAQLEG